MKLLVTYHKVHNEYVQAWEALRDIINEYDALFQITQPKASSYDDEIIIASSEAKTERFVIKAEQTHIYDRIDRAKRLLEERRQIADGVEEKLRASNDLYDIIYVSRWIDGHTVNQTDDVLKSKGYYYSHSHIYYLIKKVRRWIER